MSHSSDRILIGHIHQAALEAVTFTKDRDRNDLETDRQLLNAVVRSLEVVGEAASRVSQEFRAAHPEIRWRTMIAMRNRLIHAYFDVDTDIVWQTIHEDLPPLIQHLEKIVPPEE